MFTIVADDVGRHDFLLTPCSRETFEIIYKNTDYHPSCFENLWRNLGEFGIAPDMIPTTLNIFMNVQVGKDGTLKILPPLSKAGDAILLPCIGPRDGLRQNEQKREPATRLD